MNSLRTVLFISTLISIALLGMSASSPHAVLSPRTTSPEQGNHSDCWNEVDPFSAHGQSAINKKRCVELRVDTAPAGSYPSTSEEGYLGLDASVTLSLDDGVVDNAIGVHQGESAVQFIWLNRFTPDPSVFPFSLNKVEVLFSGNGLWVGDAIDLVIYQDKDGKPPGNAEWLATYKRTIKAIDGFTWSTYTLNPPVELNGPGDVLIGVINRFVDTGLSPQSFPASIDQTSSKRRSWSGWWATDPPRPPILPPNDTWGLIDDAGYPGNWMIRGYGETSSRKVYLPITTKRYLAFFKGSDENEPNNDWQNANGLLRSGKNYFGYPDEKDYFSFFATESGSILVDLTNHTGQGVQLQLFYRDINHRVAYDTDPPFHIELKNQPLGLYYIYIYTNSGHNQANKYTLNANFP